MPNGPVASRSLFHPDPQRAREMFFHLIGYRTHDVEVNRFHLSPARIRIPIAPARSSKSMSGAAEAAFLGMPTTPLQDSLAWIVGIDYPTNKEFQYVWKWIVEGHQKIGIQGRDLEKSVNNPQNGNMQIVLNLGKDEEGITRRSVWEGKSSSNPRSLQGEEVTTGLLSEACEHPEEIWTKYLAVRTWNAIFPSTPKPQATWVKDMIDQGLKDPTLGIESFTYPPSANPEYRPPSAAEPLGSLRYQLFVQEQRKADLRAKDEFGPNATYEDDPFFAEQFLGHWVYYTGQVIPFRRSRHVIPVTASSLSKARYEISVDYGYRDAAVALLWAITRGGAYVLLDEVYESQLTSADFAERIEDMIDRHDVDVDRIIGDPTKPDTNELFRRDLRLPIYEGDKNAIRDREAGHRKLTDLLTPQPWEDGRELPKLFVSDRCTRTIHEWESLRWNEKAKLEGSSSAFGKQADHAFDAARYFAMSRSKPSHDAREPDWLLLHQRNVQRRSLARYARHAAYA